MEQKNKYPLAWPVGYARTTKRIRSPFKQTMDHAQRFLRDEITRLKGTDLIVSTNLPIRLDGGIYSMYMDRKIDDPGVAIYFNYKGKAISMCCDQYLTVWENIYALGKGIEALRGMERWGVSDFLDRAFTGFTALPEHQPARPWWKVLGLDGITVDEQKVLDAYRRLSKIHHPDVAGGNTEQFHQITDARDRGITYIRNLDVN